MIPGVSRVCLGCNQLTTYGSRCEKCRGVQDRAREARRGERPHYQGNYAGRARVVRESTVVCAICGDGARQGDPWQADHIIEGDPSSPLQGVHRSCNIRKSHELRKLDKSKDD